MALRIQFDASQIGLSNGAAVPQWDDLSGLSNHAVQATGTNQPTYQTGVINGHPIVRFDGINDFLSITNTDAKAITNNAAGLTIIMVASLRVTSATLCTSFCFSTGTVTGNARAKFGQRTTGSGVWGVAGRQLDADGQTSVDGTASVAGFGVLSARFNWAGSDVDLWRNNVSVAAATNFFVDGNTSATNALSVAVGARSDGGAEFWDGDIAEVQVYDTALSAGARNAVEDALTLKWLTVTTVTPTFIRSQGGQLWR